MAHRKRARLGPKHYWNAFRSAIHTSPRSIALGISIGVFVAFTPTFGFQMILAVMLAVMLNASATTAACVVWINNPYTLTTISVLSHEVGHIFIGSRTGFEVDHLLQVLHGYDGSLFSLNVYQSFQQLLNSGGSIFVSMLLGGVITGLILSSVMYPFLRKLVSHWQRKVRKHYRRRSHDRRHRSPLSKHIKPESPDHFETDHPYRKAA